jgi:hypothetical protein
MDQKKFEIKTYQENVKYVLECADVLDVDDKKNVY